MMSNSWGVWEDPLHPPYEFVRKQFFKIHENYYEAPFLHNAPMCSLHHWARRAWNKELSSSCINKNTDVAILSSIPT